jgi:phosphohistidine phosphatase
MKTLLLLRHAKSSWKHAELADHERPLKKRGRQAAKRMGQLLRELDLVPQHILTSTATRACETARLAAGGMQYHDQIESVPALYHAEPPTFVAIVSHVPERFQRLLLVGHNPGLEDWVARMIGRHEDLPTAALARIELPIESWLDLTPDAHATLHGLWRWKDL